MRKPTMIALVTLFCLALATGATVAAGNYTLFGDAVLVSPGNASPTAVKLTSLCPTGSPTCFGDNTFTFSGVDFAVPAGMTFADLSNLSTDYLFTVGSCGGGSPRFQINLDSNGDGLADGSIFVYIGPPPNYTACPPNVWANTGNLASPGNLVDASQFGGAFYDPYALAQTSYGGYAVTGIQLVADGGWAVAGNNQTAVADNVAINATTFTFESANSCKKNGWQLFTSAPGPFKNQGQCVAFFEHQK